MAPQKRTPRFRRVKPAPFRLTSRDRRILELVAAYRLLDSEHIVALLGEGSTQHLRRRLQLLYHGQYLDRPRAQLHDLFLRPGASPMVYTLGKRGAELLGVSRPKPPKVQFFEHSLAISSVLVAFAVSCREAGNVRLIPFEEILRSNAPEQTQRGKTPGTWRVRIPGLRSLGVTPDAIFGLHFEDMPEGRNRAYFFVEVDRGTMPVVREDMRGTSILRKLTAYQETAAQRIHTERFGIKNFRVLTVTTSVERRDSMIEAAQRLKGLQGLFLFGEQKTLCEEQSVLGYEWVNGRGELVRLLE